jgi:hypothetical protein
MLENYDPAIQDEFPTESLKETVAINSLRETLDEDLNFRELFNVELEEADEWQKEERRYRKKLHGKMGRIYVIYCLAHNDPSKQKFIERKCGELKISCTAASHLSILIIKLLLRPSEKSVYQYALALRYASLKEIAPDNLAHELGKTGNGIAEFARRFSDEMPKKKQQSAADESDEVDDVSGSERDDDDDSDSDDEAGSRADASDEEEEEEPTLEDPKVKWGSKLLKQYREVEAGTKWWIRIEKLRGNRAKIVKRTLDIG